MNNITDSIHNTFYSPDTFLNKKDMSIGIGALKILLIYLVGLFIFTAIHWSGPIASVAEYINEENLAELYPDELEVTLENGIVSTNVEEPYRIVLYEDKDITYNLTIDTSDELGFAEIRANEGITLGKDSINFMESDGELTSIQIDKESNFVVTENSFIDFVDGTRGYMYLAAFSLLVLFLLFMSVLTVVFHLFLSLFAAVIVKYYLKSKASIVTYGQAYALSVRIFVAIAILDVVYSLITGIFTTPTWLYILLFVAILIANTNGRRELPDPEFEQVSEPELGAS